MTTMKKIVVASHILSQQNNLCTSYSKLDFFSVFCDLFYDFFFFLNVEKNPEYGRD